MTTLCGGGASAPKSGVLETIIFTAGSLSSLLNNKGGYWATLAAPLLGVLAYNATNLCTTDPPAQPTISDEEYAALLQLGPWDTLTTALGKLADIVTRLVWFDMCECTSVATPSLPVDTLDPPADVTLPTYGGSGPCPAPRARLTIAEPVPASFQQWTNVTRLVFPGFPILQSVANSGFESQDCIVVPTNWTGGVARLSLVSGTNPGAPRYAVILHGLNAARQVVNTIVNVGVTNPAPFEEIAFNFSTSLWKYIQVNVTSPTEATTNGVVDYELDIACSGDAPPTMSECCSDPAVIALLSQLMQQVNLIQRQQVPFGYVPGTVHSGLTDTGEIAVQGLLGALIEITAGAAAVGTLVGTPDQTFEAGWIAWGNVDGFTLREFLSNETLVSLPTMAGQFTRIGYTLPVGVTVTITELERES